MGAPRTCWKPWGGALRHTGTRWFWALFGSKAEPFHLAAPNDAVSARDTRDPLRVPTRSISHMGPLGNTNIQFPMSLVLTSDETLQLAWGRGDRASHLSALHPEWLTSRLKHLHLRNHTRRPGFWFDDARIIEQDVPVRQFAGERYFTVVRDAPGRGWWLLSRRARALFLRWSSDGLEFSNRKLVLEGDAACNAAALQVQGIALVALRAIAARNPLVATNGTAFRGDWTHVLVVGGKSGDGSFAPHRRDGVRGAVAFDLDPSGGVLRETFTKPLFQGNGNGCVEGRGGSRVLLRTSCVPSLSKSPRECVEFAADLAAYFGGGARGGDDAVEVMYTDSRRVAKRGSRVGQLKPKKRLGTVWARPDRVAAAAREAQEDQGFL